MPKRPRYASSRENGKVLGEMEITHAALQDRRNPRRACRPGSILGRPQRLLIGRVALDEDANIWFGCVLRGDNEWITVGARTNIQDNCVLHTDMGFPLDIGADCTIGHNVILHSCAIGDNSLIGMGATILNGAKIGRNCLVGANALVSPRARRFPTTWPDGAARARPRRLAARRQLRRRNNLRVGAALCRGGRAAAPAGSESAPVVMGARSSPTRVAFFHQNARPNP